MIGTEFFKGQGFGNQLWVYASLRSLAIDQNLDFSIIGSHRFKGKDFMKLDFGAATLRSSARIPRERTPGAFTSYLREELIREPQYNFDVSPGDVNFFQLKPNTLLDGNMQSLSYISAHKNEISNWFKVPGETFDGCVINFRGGEYKGISNVFLGPNYYKKAIEHMLSINANMNFLVVTDDAEKAREYFPNYRIISSGGVKIIAGRIYISPPSKLIGRDFAILQNARHLILSNSSFSWWGAWTNQRAEVVIAPKYWAAYNVSKSFWSTAEIAEPTWTWKGRES
jgi:hypothetical protein